MNTSSPQEGEYVVVRWHVLAHAIALMVLVCLAG